MKVGFIGLGIMGTPMAANLIKGGHQVFLYSIPSIPQPLVDTGGTAYANGKEVAQKADIVITMVPDTPHVEAALFGLLVAGVECQSCRREWHGHAGWRCYDGARLQPRIRGLSVTNQPIRYHVGAQAGGRLTRLHGHPLFRCTGGAVAVQY